MVTNKNTGKNQGDKGTEGQGVQGLAAGIAGGGIFLTFLLGLSLPLIPSLGAGLAGFGIAWTFFKPRKPEALDGVDKGMKELVEIVVSQGQEKEAAFRQLAKQMPVGEVKLRVFALAELTKRIVSDVLEDPKDHKAAGRFLDYYAEAALRIAKIYLEVSARGVQSQEFKSLSVKVEKNLETLEKAFTVQLAKLQEDNLLDLDTELNLLERTLQMEGMMDAISKEEKL